MGLFSSMIDPEELMPGDHIYSWRGLWTYAHHGIYEGHSSRYGSHTVIHFKRQEGGVVVTTSLSAFLAGGDLYRFSYSVSAAVFMLKMPGTCTMAPCDDPNEVLHRARYLSFHGFCKYVLVRKNCEDFAIYCKTGLLSKTTTISGQMDTLGLQYIYRYTIRIFRDISNRTDLPKIKVENVRQFMQETSHATN